MPLLPGVVRELLTHEDNAFRFEIVATDLCSAAEGRQFVPTSRTRDLGRDARRISPGSREIPGVICATLQADLDPKIERDLERLTKTTKTKAIFYCTTQPLTEEALNRIEAAIRRRFSALESVRALGRTQFEYLGERFEDVIRRRYAGEIQNIEDTLLRSPLRERPEQTALRLALLTQTGDDAQNLRRDLTRRLVLETLAQRGALGPGDLAARISQALHLPRVVSRNYIEQILVDLAREHLIEADGTSVRLTESGAAYLNSVPDMAAARLLEGRAAVRAAIKGLSGHSLTDSQFDRVWRTLQDALAELFWSHGQSVVHMVSCLIFGDDRSARPDERGLLEGVANKVHSLFDEADQAEEVRQAIIDMFCQKGSDAFDWLTQIASVYVMMCSLGFEALSGQEVARALRGYRLVADSDITISLLCQREDNHEEVVRVLRGWRALGGAVLAAVPVLEEVAYHAWISQRDYAALRDRLDRISDDDARRIVYNAFVRTFRKLHRENPGAAHWDRYISAYRGRDGRDYSRILEILQDDEGFDLLPDPEGTYAAFAQRIQDAIVELIARGARCRPEELDYRVRDKAARDGWLVATVRAVRDRAHEAGVGTTLIVSSSGLLREVGGVFRAELGNVDISLSTAAVASLLTLVPDVHMGLGTLRGVLFDLGLAERLTPVQRYAYRIIALSGEWEVPWARRVTLKKELAARLLADARARGKPVSTLMDRVLRAEEPQFSAKIVVDALDSMAVSSSTEREREALLAEIERLRARVAELEERESRPR